MKIVRRALALAALLVSVLGLRCQAAPVRAEHLSVELMTAADPIAPGQDFLAGLHFVLDKGWHIYWINAGDAGEPPTVNWQLPQGITAGPIKFPAPQRLPLGPLMDFGYENEVLLPIPMHAAASLKPGMEIALRGHLRFLVCSNVCIPGQAQIAHDVKVAAAAGMTDAAALLAAAEKRLPGSLPAGGSVRVTETKSAFLITLDTGQRIGTAEFYPLDANMIANAAPQPVKPLANGVRLTVQKAPSLAMAPAELRGVLKLANGTAYQFTAPVSTAAPEPAKVAGQSIGRVLLLAFVGGLILNLMPCVFPVLFIKGLSLVQSSGAERSRLRAHGAVYALGIVVSFWAIVAVLLLVRAGGTHLGWGFQFQSPYFVSFMALLFFFLGLSLAGQFEIGLSATSVGGELAARGGYSGSFFTGVLATVVATPCTAPFMGAAIGFALAQPAAVTLLVFTLLALGLAAPYVLLTIVPAWTRLLPRPGAWMETLKQAFSIPIFLAVIWMVWVFAQTLGADGVAALLVGMLITAIAGWVLGRWPATRAAAIAAMLLLVAAIALQFAAARRPHAPAQPASSVAGAWQPFSPAELAAYRAKGTPVFVDFSAAWCLSCQVNERLVLDRPEILASLRAHGVIPMRADWTHHDDTITEALRQLGRSGVPTYALFPGAPQAAPMLLPEVLTPAIVLNALDRAQGKR